MNWDTIKGLHMIVIALIITAGLFINAIPEPVAFGLSSIVIFSLAYIEYKMNNNLEMLGTAAVGLSFVGAGLVQSGIGGETIQYIVYALIGVAMIIGLYNVFSGARGVAGSTAE